MVTTDPPAHIGQPAAVPDDATSGGATGPGTGPLVMLDDDPGLDAAGWKALGIGFGLAVCTQIFSFLEMLVGYFVVLVHEMGHAIAGWLFGYPSLPAFDFTYGGGVTSWAWSLKMLSPTSVLRAGRFWFQLTA